MDIVPQPATAVHDRAAGQVDPTVFFRLPLLILLVALGTKGVVETDMWGHMRFGLDLLASKALPVFDRYAFTSTQPWINHEWLSDLIFAAAYSTGGLALLAAVRALSVGVAVWALERAMRQAAWPLRDALVVLVVFIALPLLAAVRPQAFSIPMYAVTLLGLAEDAAWLPFVFALWANIHGGWMIGLGAVFARTAVQPSPRRFVIAAASAAATLVNPYGYRLWISLADAIQRGWGDVLEWRPVWDLSHGAGGAVIWAAIAAAVAYALWRRVPASRWEWAWTLAVALASARARRHIPFFAITAAVLVLSRLPVRAPRIPKVVWSPLAGVLVAIPIVAGIAVSLSVVWPTATCLPAQNPPVRPEASAVRFIRSAGLHGRMLMWFDWGLYAVWHVGDRLQVSIDNRRETVYPRRRWTTTSASIAAKTRATPTGFTRITCGSRRGFPACHSSNHGDGTCCFAGRDP